MKTLKMMLSGMLTMAIAVLMFSSVAAADGVGVGPDMALLARIGAAVLWIGALLATLLGLDRLFQVDQEDGSLDLMHLSGVPLELIVATKALAHWLATGLPLVIAAPLFGIFVNLPAHGIGAVTLTLLVGTPALTFFGAVGAALTATLRRGGLLVSILTLPLTVPVLIFGVAASQAAITGPAPFLPPFLILCALSLFAMVLGSVAAAFALRAGLE